MVNEYLYKHAEIQKVKKSMIQEQARMFDFPAEQFNFHPSKGSQAIYERRLRAKLASMFDRLSHDRHDLVLTRDNLNPDLLGDERLQQIFEPLFDEMDGYDETLNRLEFVESALVLLS